MQFPVDWELDPNFPKLDLNFSSDPNFPTCFYKLQAFPAVQSGPTLKTATLSSKGKGSVEGNDSMGRSWQDDFTWEWESYNVRICIINIHIWYIYIYRCKYIYIYTYVCV